MNAEDKIDSNAANACLGLYGISGTGKSRQCDEAARDVAEQGYTTMMVVPDLGGWGNSRQSLIDAGIVSVYYPCNHVEPFATMELLSLGWWPEEMIDRRTGLAAPDVPFVAPRMARWTLICANGHKVVTLKTERQVAEYTGECPECHMPVTAQTCLRIDRTVIRHKLFNRVGLRCFDSFTQLNEWGMSDRADQGAQIKHGAPDAAMRSALAVETELPEGKFTFGTNDITHYGFLQNRSRGWIQNIRSIPDQIARPILTFNVECSKGSDETGGKPIYGPKISGNARTGNVPGWLGNCFHLERSPEGHYRIWLKNHFDPQTGIEYVAKHRGEPGLPEYLEDPDEAHPFTVCSLRHFFDLERTQLAAVAERDAKLKALLQQTKVPEDDIEEVISETQGVGAPVPAGPVAMIAGGTTTPAVGRVAHRSRAMRPGVVAAPTVAVTPPSPQTVAVATAPTAPAVVPPPPAPSGQPPVSSPPAPTGGASAPVAAPPVASDQPSGAIPTQAAPVAATGQPQGPQRVATRIARRARPVVG